MAMNSRHMGLLYAAAMMAMTTGPNIMGLKPEDLEPPKEKSERKPPEKKMFKIHGVEIESTSYKAAMQKAKRMRKNKSKNKRKKKKR